MKHTLKDISTPFFTEPDSIVPIAVQDTTTLTVPSDTIEDVHEGINPLLIQMERRMQEVEQIRSQEEAQQVHVVRVPRVAPVDTTCYICPQSATVPIYETIEWDQLPTPSFVQNLYNRSYYEQHFGAKGPVFIETIEQAKRPVTMFEKPIEKAQWQSDWLLFPIVTLVLLGAMLKVFFYQQIVMIFRSSMFFFIAKKIATDSSALWKRFNLILDIVFLLSVGIFASLLAQNFEHLLNFEVDKWLVATYTIVGFIGFGLFKYISTRAVGSLTRKGDAFRSLNYHQFLYPRLLGLFLTPLIVLYAYSNPEYQNIFLYTSIVLTIIALLYRTLRTAQVFFDKGFSMFYFILYLCALEIIPVLIIIKEVVLE